MHGAIGAQAKLQRKVAVFRHRVGQHGDVARGNDVVALPQERRRAFDLEGLACLVRLHFQRVLAGGRLKASLGPLLLITATNESELVGQLCRVYVVNAQAERVDHHAVAEVAVVEIHVYSSVFGRTNPHRDNQAVFAAGMYGEDSDVRKVDLPN
ncbi:hypothetical protein D3C87_1422730 [compost metagenome]